jgi:hypothetical protein
VGLTSHDRVTLYPTDEHGYGHDALGLQDADHVRDVSYSDQEEDRERERGGGEGGGREMGGG